MAYGQQQLTCQQPRALQVPVRGTVPVAPQRRRPDRRSRRLSPVQRAGGGVDLVIRRKILKVCSSKRRQG